MKRKILMTNGSLAPTALRVILGLVIFPHGAQKLFGWFGGYGFAGTMDYFTDTIGLPWIVGFAVILLEVFGAIALAIGIATRITSAFYLFLALGIAFSVHIQHGFFMNWYGNQSGEGYEYFLLWIGMAIALILMGGGKYSLDRKLMAREK